MKAIKMKLEIKHIAPYMPYSIKYYPDEKSELYPTKYNGVDSEYLHSKEESNEYYLTQNEPFFSIEDGELFLGQFTSSLGFDVDDVFASEVKPILRTTSDLTKSELLEIVNHIFRDSKGIRPKQDSVKCEKGYISFYDLNTMQNYVAVKPSSDGTPLLNMSNCFEDYQVFFKLHIDMFNLIDKGLAVDIKNIQD